MLKLLDEQKARHCDGLSLSPRWRGRECAAVASAAQPRRIRHLSPTLRLQTVHLYELMRAYRRRVIETVTFEGDGFAAFTEMLLRAGLQGYKVAEIPMVLKSRAVGTSKMKVMYTIRTHLKH